MTECNSGTMLFQPSNGKKVEAEFTDKEITSDGGLLLLREVNSIIGLTKSAAQHIPDERDSTRISHTIEEMLIQRLFGIALGYEDLNDHTQFRHDPAIKLSVNKNLSLASSSTLCRFENSIDYSTNFFLHKVKIDLFINSHTKAPKQIILDADPTDDAVHGNQENKAYHGYYGHYCFLPLHVYCGKQLLVSYLRPSNIDPAKHVAGIMRLLVNYIRKHWPNVNIIFRADGGLCRDKLLRWFERNNINYILGYSRNTRLASMTKGLVARASFDYEKTGEKQKLYDQVYYSAHSWPGDDRKIIVKAEYGEQGKNIRFLVTNMRGLPEKLYKFYCKRGDAENRIKEVKLDCYSDRTSCHAWNANQFRLILSSFAYILLESIRRLSLNETKFKNATCDTIRSKLLKIGAVITSSKRRIHIAIAECFVNRTAFMYAHRALSAFT